MAPTLFLKTLTPKIGNGEDPASKAGVTIKDAINNPEDSPIATLLLVNKTTYIDKKWFNDQNDSPEKVVERAMNALNKKNKGI